MPTQELFSRRKWFNEARIGTFIHFGPYAQYGRGEQVLFRENLDQREYAQRAMTWTAPAFSAPEWLRVFADSGAKYAVMTTRHHDGFCLWDTQTTEYSACAGAAKRDFIGEYVEACRAADLRVGLYYSLPDWRDSAYFRGPEADPEGFAKFIQCLHDQVQELVTNYGKIDLLWFDGAWPYTAKEWQSYELVEMIRSHQPDVLINDRLGATAEQGIHEQRNFDETLSDFNTCEQEIKEFARLWESCHVTTSRLWGWHSGESWKSVRQLLCLQAEAVSRGGNFLLNVGPKPDGSLPTEYLEQMRAVGEWLRLNGAAIYGAGGGDVVESITLGYQTVRGKSLYLIMNFWDGSPQIEIPGIATSLLSARLLGSDAELSVTQNGNRLTVRGLPTVPPVELLPVLRLDFAAPPEAEGMFKARLWQDDVAPLFAPWADSLQKN